jgi:hypothetical protein
MATHAKRGTAPKALSKLVDAETWLEPVHGGHPVCYWSVGRGSWVIQSRDSKVSAYLRGLKTVRKVGHAVAGTHQTLWRFDGTERKMRMVVRGLAQAIGSSRLASVENQQKPFTAVFLP